MRRPVKSLGCAIGLIELVMCLNPLSQKPSTTNPAAADRSANSLPTGPPSTRQTSYSDRNVYGNPNAAYSGIHWDTAPCELAVRAISPEATFLRTSASSPLLEFAETVIVIFPPLSFVIRSAKYREAACRGLSSAAPCASVQLICEFAENEPPIAKIVKIILCTAHTPVQLNDKS